MDIQNPSPKTLNPKSSLSSDLDQKRAELEAYLKASDNPYIELLEKKGVLEDLLHKEAKGYDESEEAEPLNADSAKAEEPQETTPISDFEKKLDKVYEGVTFGSAGVNFFSILSSAISLEDNNLSGFSEKLEKFGLSTTKAQAILTGLNYIQKSLRTKNIILLLAGLSQGFKLISGFDRLIRLSGIASGLDSMPFAINPISGKAEYKSFGESIQESVRITKDVMKEFFDDPIDFMKYFKLNAPKGHTKTLIPLGFGMMGGAVLSNIFDFPIFGILRQPLTILGSLIRHGSGALADYAMSKDESNDNVKKAGIIYLAGSALDFGGLFLKNQVGHMMHQLGCLLNPIAEIYAMHGASSDDGAKDKEQEKNKIVDFERSKAQAGLEAVPA
ncbi:MAG: hypothetical protein MK033_09250 [Candidatus Caenarcaniphilales bacterium]|nr:hypothetical protein [Candidatus Caenarcaniphilales bacterium]